MGLLKHRESLRNACCCTKLRAWQGVSKQEAAALGEVQPGPEG